MTSQNVQSLRQIAVQQNQLAKFPEIEQLIESARIPNLKVEVLGRSVGIVVPTTVDAIVPADTSFHAEQTKQYMAEWFGGVSCLEQEGLYISSSWGLIREQTIVVRSFATTEALHQHFPLLLHFVGYLQRQLRQESMAVELDGKMLLLQFP